MWAVFIWKQSFCGLSNRKLYGRKYVLFSPERSWFCLCKFTFLDHIFLYWNMDLMSDGPNSLFVSTWVANKHLLFSNNPNHYHWQNVFFSLVHCGNQSHHGLNNIAMSVCLKDPITCVLYPMLNGSKGLFAIWFVPSKLILMSNRGKFRLAITHFLMIWWFGSFVLSNAIIFCAVVRKDLTGLRWI